MNLARRVTAEAIGTAFLLATVVGSGIMGERLAGGNVAIALLANTIATGAGLVALILTFGPMSGAHFNPAVTLANASQGGLRWREAPPYIVAQVIGAFVGVAAAHLMFSEPLFSASRRARRRRADLQRVHRHVRPAGGHPELFRMAPGDRAICGRRIHHRRLLVYIVNFVCEPRRDAGQGRERYVRGHSPLGCARLRRGPSCRRSGGCCALSLACAINLQRQTSSHHVAR